MKLSEAQARERLARARVARLATAGDDRRPHLVPVTFAVDGGQICVAIDHKPKTTTNLRRLRNIRENPRVALLADHYEEDWSMLWWVRADGQARVIDPDGTGTTGGTGTGTGTTERQRALDILAAKYDQYRRVRPEGPVIAITAERITGWSGDA
ncbi:MAG: TIGR03668 family PPOX class F420-dependent oxidoreductase [Streptosporangiales bacterium]|nr:TIGR03668 family PPOX class F420-dependent oxidoreductase [Streptosporangiales bacterium]